MTFTLTFHFGDAIERIEHVQGFKTEDPPNDDRVLIWFEPTQICTAYCVRLGDRLTVEPSA